MDPVTLIVAALVAGAAAGVGEVATSAVSDAYSGLKALIRKKFAGRSAAEVTLEEHEKAPDAWESALRQQITETGADQDAEIRTVAEALLKDARAAGITTKYDVDVAGDVGIIGDHGRIENFKSK